MEKYLMDRKLLTDEQKKQIAADIVVEMDAAIEFAEQSPYPDISEAPNFVWTAEAK
jgi:TPP-dependent pyruvate/acetoin dehydrogenase alpha subunit